MPYEWVPPDVFLEHSGMTVYHCYKDGCYMEYWYCTDELETDNEWGNSHFDVRDIRAKFTPEQVNTALGLIQGNTQQDAHAAVIRVAIDAGLVS